MRTTVHSPMSTPRRVEAPDVQGFIISAYPHLTCSRYVLLHVHTPADARRWLGQLVPQVTSAHWKDSAGRRVKPAAATNVAFTSDGLAALGLAEAVIDSFPEEFRQGMADADRARRLGDNGDSDPAKWEYGGPTAPPDSKIHVLLILKAGTETEAGRLLQERWSDTEASSGMTAVAIESGHVLPMQREHFGFHDGVSQPEIEGSPKKGKAAADCLKAGEFILGYENEYGILPATPLVPDALDPQGILPRFGAVADAAAGPGQRDLGRNGTYLVFRKLQQDVAAFRSFVLANGAAVGGSELLAAKMVGRWPSGTSLVDSPTHDAPPPVGAEPSNTFGYVNKDPYGLVCPLGAHVRRSNPRDSMSDRTPAVSVVDARRHRILRRGISYGPPLPNDQTVDDGRPRGLLFQAVNADIKRQFEFIQQTWTNNPKFHGLNNDRDPLIGDNVDPSDDLTTLPPRVFTVQRDGVRCRLTQLPRFVTMRGGAYFFIPGLAALRYIVAMQGT